MNLQQLRYLCAVVDADMNVSRASQKVFTSQPGISKQIRLLEEELGVQLFNRHGKHLSGLSEVGADIVDRARVMLQQAEGIHRSAADAVDPKRGSLSVATTHTQSRYMLPPVISRFVRRYPEVELHLQQGTPRQIAQLAASGDADFAIATEALEEFENLVRLPCFRWNRVVLVPAGHPLLKEETLSLARLAQFPLVTYVHGFTGRAQLDRAFQHEGLQHNVVITAADADVIKTYVRLGMGVGIIAGMAVEKSRDRDLRVLDASHLFEWSTTCIAFRRESYLRTYMLDFISMFAPHLSRRVVEEFIATEDGARRDELAAALELPSYT